MKEIAVMLHNVRSAHNVGSIFRTADAAGVARMYLTGVTPAPLDRFGRSQKEIAKVALGAEKSLLWEKATSASRVIARLKKKRWYIVGVEQSSRSRDYRTSMPKRPALYIFGNEVRGLPRSLLAKCDTVVEIPMRGTKESLNVAVAAGVILFSGLNS